MNTKYEDLMNSKEIVQVNNEVIDMKIIFNNAITEVAVYEKLKHDSALILTTRSVKVGVKFFIFPIFKKMEGLFYRYDHDYWGSIEEYNTLPRNTYFDGVGFYFKPHCKIILNNGNYHKKYFENVEDLKQYVE